MSLVSTITLLLYERVTLENGPRAFTPFSFFLRMPGEKSRDSRGEHKDKVYRASARTGGNTTVSARASNARCYSPAARKADR